VKHVLIVEGNSEQLLAANAARGFRQASEGYRDALALHAPSLAYSFAYPFATHREHGVLPLERYDGFVLTGAGVPQSAGEPGTEPYMRFLDKVLATGKPVLGSCWGLQVAAVALGGAVAPNARGSEIGLALDIELTAEGAAHPLYSGSPRRFHSPCWHRDHVTRMPPGAIRLAGNAISEVQAMEYRRNGVDYLGFQYHPETPLWEMKQSYDGGSGLLASPAYIVNFPDDPGPEVSNDRLRTRAIGNWLRYVEAMS